MEITFLTNKDKSVFDQQIFNLANKVNTMEQGGTTTFVTPEMYGAVGDGVHDDAPALKAALESGKDVILTQDLWLLSDIIIKDHNVNFDGKHYTLHCVCAGIGISASTWQDGRVGECSKVSNNVQSEFEAARAPYHQGYLTYKGRKTLQEEYEDYSVTYFDIYRAEIRNVTMLCEKMDNGEGKSKWALALYYMCDSVIEQVNTTLIDDGDGAEGICCLYCQNVRIESCHSAGWTIQKNSATDGRGYGFQVVGDNICISRCSGEQNKHCITVGSSHDVWSSNITIEHCNLRCDFTKILHEETRSGKYRQLLDVHGDAVNVVITGCNFYWWALDGNTQSSPIIALRAPSPVLSNCSVHSNGGWINFGEFARSIHINQLYAPQVHLTTDFSLNGDSDKTHFIPELFIVNSEFARLRDSFSPARVHLTGCIIREFVIDVQYLIARDCIFSRERPWASQPTMVLNGESILSNCIIYGHREDYISKRTPIIKAPKNSVHMSNCKIYKRQGDYLTFDAEQDEGTGNWYEDVFAFYLDTQDQLNTNTLQ